MALHACISSQTAEVAGSVPGYGQLEDDCEETWGVAPLQGLPPVLLSAPWSQLKNYIFQTSNLR
jgi:hypothetical protein